MSSSESSDPIPQREYVFSLLLWPRSLLVLRHDAYTSYLHEIEELTSDIVTCSPSAVLEAGDSDSKPKQYYYANLDSIPREELNRFQQDNSQHSWTIPRATRYSFTIRYVPNVLKKLNLQKLLFKK